MNRNDQDTPYLSPTPSVAEHACNDMLFIDLEWDWLDKNGNELPFDQFELIEIGAVVSNPNIFGAVDRRVIFDQLVRPESKDNLSFKFEKLTKIKNDQLKLHGLPLTTALKSFFAKAAKYDTWATWGSRDIMLLKVAAARVDIEMPMPSQITDIKREFCKTYKVKSASLVRALCMINASHRGTSHRAANDALNAAKVYAHALQKLAADSVSNEEFELWLGTEYPELLKN